MTFRRAEREVFELINKRKIGYLRLILKGEKHESHCQSYKEKSKVGEKSATNNYPDCVILKTGLEYSIGRAVSSRQEQNISNDIIDYDLLRGMSRSRTLELII